MSVNRRVDKLEDEEGIEEYFDLSDGSRYSFERDQLYKAFFLYHLATLGPDAGGEERPPVPELFEAIAQAKGRRAAMTQINPSWETEEAQMKCAVNLTVLVKEGRVEPFNLAALIMATDTEGGF